MMNQYVIIIFFLFEVSIRCFEFMQLLSLFVSRRTILISYRGLEESNIDSFVEEVLVNGRPWDFATAEVVTSSYVFVCAHNSRDKRCGVCGPALIEKFNEEIEVNELKDQVFVSPCSHVAMLGDTCEKVFLSGSSWFFYQMLVLKTGGYIDVKQAKPYDEIRVMQTPKLEEVFGVGGRK